MKYYIVAGEASGDLHGSNLIKQIKVKDPKSEFRFFGGDLMEAEGGTLVSHYNKMAFMGIIDVVINLGKILRNMRKCKRDIEKYKPDVLILIDSAAFNLRIAKHAHSKGIKTAFYISPKIWAWQERRIHAIKKYVDRMFVILPFEVDYYQKKDYPVTYVGNPLLDSIRDYKNFKKDDDFLSKYELTQPYIALLAGSRKQEINNLLPVLLEIARAYPKHKFVLAAAPSFNESVYKSFQIPENVKFVYNQTYDVLSNAHAAIVTSGTATLETALLNCPQIIVYKVGNFGYHFSRLFVDIAKFKYISLVNLIASKEVVREFIQYDLFANVKLELKRMLEDNEYRTNILDEYKIIQQKIGDYKPSEKLAEEIYQWIS